MEGVEAFDHPSLFLQAQSPRTWLQICAHNGPLYEADRRVLAASLGPDSDHKHIPLTENRLKTLVQNPDLTEEKVQKKKEKVQKAGWAC